MVIRDVWYLYTIHDIPGTELMKNPGIMAGWFKFINFGE